MMMAGEDHLKEQDMEFTATWAAFENPFLLLSIEQKRWLYVSDNTKNHYTYASVSDLSSTFQLSMS